MSVVEPVLDDAFRFLHSGILSDGARLVDCTVCQTSCSDMALNTTEEIIEDLRQGRMVIIMDDEDRENEGDLILASETTTPEAINFMAKARPWPDLPDADQGALPPPVAPAADGQQRQPAESTISRYRSRRRKV